MERHFKKMIRNYLPNIQVVVPSIFLNTQNQSTPPAPTPSQINRRLLLPRALARLLRSLLTLVCTASPAKTTMRNQSQSTSTGMEPSLKRFPSQKKIDCTSVSNNSLNRS